MPAVFWRRRREGIFQQQPPQFMPYAKVLYRAPDERDVEYPQDFSLFLANALKTGSRLWISLGAELTMFFVRSLLAARHSISHEKACLCMRKHEALKKCRKPGMARLSFRETQTSPLACGALESSLVRC
jgi:hypothetical protein